jgi:hypothetical protein
MEYDLMDTHCADDRGPSPAQESIPTKQSSLDSLLSSPMYSDMSVPMLAVQCLRELENYRQGEPCSETYAVELFRRATVQSNKEARAWVQHCFREVVRDWLRHHPNREAACCLESEEYYVAQAFERFWQATVSTQRLEFSRLSAALQYLCACLHGAILDTLRAFARSKELGLPGPGESGKPQVKDSANSSEAWGILKTILPNVREQRLAYLLFHCGLRPGEIVRFCPQEFSDVREIYRLRHNIIKQLLRNIDSL